MVRPGAQLQPLRRSQVRTITIIINKAPYGTTTVGEGLRAAIALAGMDILTKVVLTDDAVYAALKQQNADTIKATPLHGALKNAKEFGARTYVHLQSVEERGISRDELMDIETVDTAGLAKMIEEADATITF